MYRNNAATPFTDHFLNSDTGRQQESQQVHK